MVTPMKKLWVGEMAVVSPAAVVSNYGNHPSAAVAFVAKMRFISLLLLTSSVPLFSIIGVSSNSEGDALIELRTSLIDPNNALQTWDKSLVNPCTWFHVTCNEENSVVSIDLGNIGFSGKLVPQLGKLTKLEKLELYNNNISGEIPTELGDLAHLKNLDLYDNNLNGPIPHTLGQCVNLTRMTLNNNRLSGFIPNSLVVLDALLVLDLSNNKLTGPIPTDLGRLASLNQGDLSGNCLDVEGSTLSSNPKFKLDNNSDKTRCA